MSPWLTLHVCHHVWMTSKKITVSHYRQRKHYHWWTWLEMLRLMKSQRHLWEYIMNSWLWLWLFNKGMWVREESVLFLPLESCKRFLRRCWTAILSFVGTSSVVSHWMTRTVVRVNDVCGQQDTLVCFFITIQARLWIINLLLLAESICGWLL